MRKHEEAMQYRSPLHEISIPVGIPCWNRSYLALFLTAVAAPTPSCASTNIYITLNELELGSQMYIAWFSLMQFKTAKPWAVAYSLFHNHEAEY